MLGSEVAGNQVEKVLIDEKLEIEREFYVGYIIEDRLKRPTLLFSAAGGSGIEDRADSMKALKCSILEEPTLDEITAFINNSNVDLPESTGQQIALILQKLYSAARACEARIAEINPLALISDGSLVAADARISVDDYAVFRRPELGIDMARELGHTPTKLERIAWDIEKDDFRGTFYFVEIIDDRSKIQNPKSKISIGFHGAGGGGSMASLDAAQRNGLEPACYVDTSGNPPASKVYRAARIILSIPGIKGYFLSGSGVASQEQFGLARAVLKAFLEVRPNIPAVLRLGGNGEDIAKEMVERYAPQLPAPIEAYQKKDSADFCASRLHELIAESEPPAVAGGLTSGGETANKTSSALPINRLQPPVAAGGFDYRFKTRTGTITYYHTQLDATASAAIVDSCPQKILMLSDERKPVLAIERADAESGKCSECLACEFASLDMGLDAVRIDFRVEGLD